MVEQKDFRSEPPHHLVSDQFIEDLKREIGNFDLKELTVQAINKFQARDFELQEWQGPGLRLNLYDTPDIQSRNVVHFEIWINHDGSKKAYIRIYVDSTKYDLPKLQTVITKYGGEIGGKSGYEIKVPIDLKDNLVNNLLQDVKSIYDDITVCLI